GEDTESNKNTINSTIRSWSTGGSTALYDTSAMAGEYMMANGRGSNVVKGFIGMTDGASNSDEDDYTHAPDEDSSKDQYAYQNDWESQTVDWDNYDSPYTGDTLSVSNDNGEYGCLGMPWNTNAVGLGSSVDPDWKWIGWSGGDSEPGGAQTSKLNWYNHTNDPNELEKIFKNFVKSVKSEAGGLKSVNPGEITPQSSKDELTATTVWEDDFEDGDLSPWTDSGSGGFAGANTDTSNSGSYSMYTSGGEVMSTSPTIDLSGYSSAKVGYWVRKGDDSFSEDPNYGEDLYFEYLDDSGNWKQIDFFESSSISDGEIVDKTGSPVDLGSDALHATFQLRFRQIDGSSGSDYWHMDDITITGTSDSGGGGGGDDSTDPETYDIKRRDYRLLTTNPTEIRDAEDMTLSFWTKYWMTEGTNGGVVYLWGSDSGSWNWDRDHRIYLKPKQSYTGNLKFDAVKSEKNSGGPLNDNGLVDANGELPYWCFNGKSQSGTFDWRYTEIPLGDYLDDFSFDHVRIAFLYARMGGISEEEGWQPEMGWYVDDVNLKVTRDSTGTIPQNDKGYWMRVSKDELVNEKGFNSPSDPGKYYDNTYGNETGHYWMYTRNDAGEDSLPQGVDTSLYTSSIALTNADNPELRAYMKFNIDEAAGLPPDGLRIEVSDDNGRTWNSLTYGIRTGWGASGDSQHGNYSGETDDASNYGWVNSGTLARLNADLSGWRGENIILRFRVFTNLTDTYDDTTLPKAIFIDDVVVRERDMQTTLASKEEAISDEEVTSSLSRDDIDRGFYDTRTGIDPLNLEKGNKIDLRYNAPSAPRLKAGDMKTIRFSDEFRTERIKERRKRC
ncbi:MAG: hypothetical protein KGY76_07870, partial [Candidatus Thermoplasmatota archaeon]|nr:hypothetical protein [Candidatus Thermoplasmatota archaeon]